MEGLWAVAVVAGGGLVAWGEMRAKVNGLRRDVDGKASGELVEHQYEEIVNRLARIERKLDAANDT